MMDNKNYQVSSEGLVSATTVDEKNMMKSVVDKIKEYVKNYDGIMLDYDGESASIHMGWDNFTDVEKDYAFGNEGTVIQNTRYQLRKDNIIVKELLVDDYGITVFVKLDKSLDTQHREFILKKVNSTMVESLLNGECEDGCITLGGKYSRYTLNYNEISEHLCFENDFDDCSGFGLFLTDYLMNFKGCKTYVEIARCMTDCIAEAFADKIIKDCGEYWVIAE